MRDRHGAAALIKAHDDDPPQHEWDHCDGCHVEMVRRLLAAIERVEAACSAREREVLSALPPPLSSLNVDAMIGTDVVRAALTGDQEDGK